MFSIGSTTPVYPKLETCSDNEFPKTCIEILNGLDETTSPINATRAFFNHLKQRGLSSKKFNIWQNFINLLLQIKNTRNILSLSSFACRCLASLAQESIDFKGTRSNLTCTSNNGNLLQIAFNTLNLFIPHQRMPHNRLLNTKQYLVYRLLMTRIYEKNYPQGKNPFYFQVTVEDLQNVTEDEILNALKNSFNVLELTLPFPVENPEIFFNTCPTLAVLQTPDRIYQKSERFPENLLEPQPLTDVKFLVTPPKEPYEFNKKV